MKRYLKISFMAVFDDGQVMTNFLSQEEVLLFFHKKELWKIREIDTTTNLKLFSHYIPRRPEINVAETAMIKIITLHNEFEAIYCRSDMSKCIVFGKYTQKYGHFCESKIYRVWISSGWAWKKNFGAPDTSLHLTFT